MSCPSTRRFRVYTRPMGLLDNQIDRMSELAAVREANPPSSEAVGEARAFRLCAEMMQAAQIINPMLRDEDCG